MTTEELTKELEKYKEAYHKLLLHCDSIPLEERLRLVERLDEILKK